MTIGSRPVGRADLDYSPWLFAEQAGPAERAEQNERQRLLTAAGARLGTGCFVSPLASVEAAGLVLGDRSYVAAGAYVTGSCRAGRDCSLNPGTVVRGRVRLGDAVRIGAHTSILGFNHSMADPAVEMFRQPLVTVGIEIGDDVWIGSHVVVLDGVTVGAHAVLGAGAVVTRDVPAGAVVGGNPARVIRYRVPPGGGPSAEPAPSAGTAEPPDLSDLTERTVRLAGRAREQARDLLDRCWDPAARLFLDRPGTAPTVRAQGDAVELADLLLGTAPPQLPAEEQTVRLRSWQDERTGTIGLLLPDGTVRPVPAPADGLVDPGTGYHVLSTGYALDLLGSRLPHPIAFAAQATAQTMVAGLEQQRWRGGTWSAGHWVDIVATALHWNARAAVPVTPGTAEALLGWLVAHTDPQTGMWGEPDPGAGLLEVVNGYYRASRGTFAQSGIAVPHPQRVVDTVLQHLPDQRYLRPGVRDACAVLDVAHPLWLTRETGHRAPEVRTAAARLLADALGRWQDGAGFGFRSGPTGHVDACPGLQGTEMWLAIVWLLADLLGFSDLLGYRPRGVHRPEPAPR
ncbi:MAG TPA: acyltransferase [Cellulomonas sp.]